MEPPNPDHARWFAEEVHPHEASLRSYVRRSFPALRDVDDVVQESYLRILRARARQPIQSAKAFLFTIARRLALDDIRRKRIAPMDSVGNAVDVVDSHAQSGVRESASRQEKVDLLAEAIAALPGRCREITLLRKVKGMCQRDVAKLLGLSERTVEVQVARGVKRCKEYLRVRGVQGWYE